MRKIHESHEWQEALEQSKDHPLFVMKHSSTCPISAAAYQEFDNLETDLPKHVLIVQDSRPVSNEIESDLGIQHASPQLFLLKDGKAVWQATHHAIRGSKIKQAIEDLS